MRKQIMEHGTKTIKYVNIAHRAWGTKRRGLHSTYDLGVVHKNTMKSQTIVDLAKLIKDGDNIDRLLQTTDMKHRQEHQWMQGEIDEVEQNIKTIVGIAKDGQKKADGVVNFMKA